MCCVLLMTHQSYHISPAHESDTMAGHFEVACAQARKEKQIKVEHGRDRNRDRGKVLTFYVTLKEATPTPPGSRKLRNHSPIALLQMCCNFVS